MLRPNPIIFISILLLAAGLGLASCSQPPSSTAVPTISPKQVSVSGGTYYQVDVQQFKSMLQNKDFTLVNVHIPFEGNISGTDVSIPYDTIDQRLDQLPADKNAKIVLYCRSGRMSAIAAETLTKKGYTNVWDLAGGMAAWEQAGNSIER